MNLRLFILFTCLIISADAADKLFQSAASENALSKYCVDCHDDESQKGDIRLDNLAALSLPDRLDLLNKIQEQIHFKHMPPKKKKKQPAEGERQMLLKWVSGELKKHDASKLEEKLRKPEFGNYVDHEKLFSGEYKNLKAFTYDRRWLINEYIFNAKFQRVLQNKSKTLGSSRIGKLSLTNPFLLPERSGVRYYAETSLDGGHLSTMLTNAQKTSAYITDYLVKRNKKYIPAISKIMAMEDHHNATLASRKVFLTNFIDRLCQEYYGSRHKSLLPKFVPVKLKEVKALKKGEKYKKAPIHVAMNSLKGLEGDGTVFRFLQNPAIAKLSDQDFSKYCEKTWFYFGDHVLKVQGRVTIIRDYLTTFRKDLDKYKKKHRPLIYKALSNPEMIVLKGSIMKHRQRGDFYNQLIDKCMKQWEADFRQKRLIAGPPKDDVLAELVEQLFVQILEREPSEKEAREYLALSKSYVSKLGNLKAIQKLIQTTILSIEFVYRYEYGQGSADAAGRKKLSPRDASIALAYALTDQSPDKDLTKAVQEGKLNSKEDYQREVLRMLKRRDLTYLIDPILADRNYRFNTTNTAIRKLRFFREFFGYPKAMKVFKDEKRFGGERMSSAFNRLLNEADRLVEYILEKDKNVFKELLTTEKFYVYHDGDNERMQKASDRIKSIYAEFKDVDWKKYKKEDLLKHKAFLKKVKMRSVNPDKLDARNRQGNTIQLFKKSMTTITERLNKGQKEAVPFDLYRGYGNDFMSGFNVGRFFNFTLDNWDYKPIQPAKVANRKGLLTHPAWLIAHAQNTETDPVIRGKWIREKLLAGTIPDVPITVDAVIPEDHHKTLRARLQSVTGDDYCWRCHVHMNPLGYALEAYDDFGRFRTDESLEYKENLIKEGAKKATFFSDTKDIYKTAPVNASGFLLGTGDKKLDGPISNALVLADKLGESSRVRQSIIRHAFRYFMGRNEVLSDSKTLIDADQAYVKNGGSFDAVIVSLLTSDSFMYRKALKE
jgi:hypothetical protein